MLPDEMDVTYLLKDDDPYGPIKQYLTFNDEDHTIKISDQLPENHPLQMFRNGNYLDTNKLYDTVRL